MTSGLFDHWAGVRHRFSTNLERSRFCKEKVREIKLETNDSFDFNDFNDCFNQDARDFTKTSQFYIKKNQV